MLLRPANRHECQVTVWNPHVHCPELDGVRGMAILLVTLYRIGKELPVGDSAAAHWVRSVLNLGERGVDLFFVLSGFLITGILLETRNKEHYFRNFLARRALRIFPLYFISLALFLWVVPALFMTSTFELARENQAYLWSYMTNVRMAWTNTWCFGPLDHFWSLAVEEHFYLVWPAIVFFMSPRWLLRLCIGTIGSVAVLRAVASTREDWAVAVDTLTVFRCDALCFGGFLATFLYLARNGRGDRESDDTTSTPSSSMQPTLLNRIWNMVSPTGEWKRDTDALRLGVWSCVVMVPIACLLVVTGKRFLTVPSTLFPAIWMFALGWMLVSDSFGWVARTMRSALLRAFGKYSYGMYVIQLPLLSCLPFAALGVDADSPYWYTSFACYYVGMFVAITAMAWLSYHAIEQRFLRLKRFFGT